MARKRKTLPKGFGEMLTSASFEELIAVFDRCEIDARGGYAKATALGFRDCPDVLVVWLVEQGLDVDSRDARGRTALIERAHCAMPTHVAQIPLLLSLGADIEVVGDLGRTAFEEAVIHLRVDAARVLAEHGASASRDGWTPESLLEAALARVENFTITAAVGIARLLLTLGAPVTDKMRTEVERIGTGFERARSAFAADMLDETLAALDELYSIFGVTPVGGLVTNDGTSPIDVLSDGWQEQHRELWDLLVPVQGTAATEQGEVIRITGKVADEMFRNGGANWNAEFREMVDGAVALLGTRTGLRPQSIVDLRELAPRVRAGQGREAELDRFSELAVEWVLRNREPHSLGNVPYTW